MREKEFGCWNNMTWAHYYEQVRRAALGLEQAGLAPGDTFAVISDNIPEMLVMAVGAQAAGGVSAGIYQSSLPGEIASILDYMDVRYVFCDDQEQVDKLIEVRDRIPKVRQVFYEDPRGMRGYRVGRLVHVPGRAARAGRAGVGRRPRALRPPHRPRAAPTTSAISASPRARPGCPRAP